MAQDIDIDRAHLWELVRTFHLLEGKERAKIRALVVVRDSDSYHRGEAEGAWRAYANACDMLSDVINKF